MTLLHKLKDTSRYRKNANRVGRGPGSGRGKTSCRGQKGEGSRSGYKRRFGFEGGGVPLYRRVPTRGFTRGRFAKPKMHITLAVIDAHYDDGEVVQYETLFQKGLAPRRLQGGIKVLANGELTKKVTIEAQRFSKEAIRKLEAKRIPYKIL